MNVYTKKRTVFWQQLVVIFVILAIIIVLLNVFEKSIKNSFFTITNSFSGAVWGTGSNVNSFFQLFSGDLQRQHDYLQEENQALSLKVLALQNSLHETQLLIDVSQNTAQDAVKTVLVNPIGLDNDILFIDRGSSDGIMENMPVISSKKVLYGKVIRVYEHFSEVMLISHKNSTVDVKIVHEDMIEKPILGAIRGEGNVGFYLDLVSSEETILENDVVFTSGIEGTFPPNLLVGKVLSITKNDLKPFQTATMIPSFEPKGVQPLFVITNYKKIK